MMEMPIDHLLCCSNEIEWKEETFTSIAIMDSQDAENDKLCDSHTSFYI